MPSCSCRLAAIFFPLQNPRGLCAQLVQKRDVAYGTYLQLVQGMNQWPPNTLNKLLPAKPRIIPGRPKKKRKRAIHELAPHISRVIKIGSIISCHKCGGQGHNQRICKEVAKDNQQERSAKPSGRPRKQGKEGCSVGQSPTEMV